MTPAAADAKLLLKSVRPQAAKERKSIAMRVLSRKAELVPKLKARPATECTASDCRYGADADPVHDLQPEGGGIGPASAL